MTKSLLKGFLTRLAGSTAIVLLAMGVFGSQPASAQITGTKHNLGSGGTGTIKSADGTTEICVFCHTPHGADTSAAVPLWNRVLPTPSTYTTYNSLGTSSLDGQTAPVGSVSLACLSCHDGSLALNVMINAPGSGGYASGGATLTGTWTGSTILPSTAITNIGIDLRNDHPIGIQYGGGPKGTTIPAAPNDYTNSDFKDFDFKPAKSATLNGQQVWWVDTGTQGDGRQKTDIQLYTRASANIITGTSTVSATGYATAQPFVECASCHDPHTAVPTFLRVSNASSALCLACHTK